MNNSLILKLIGKIKKPELSTLADIAKHSRAAFYHKTSDVLSYAECKYLYTHATHSAEHTVRRSVFTRSNPQLKNIKSLQPNDSFMYEKK